MSKTLRIINAILVGIILLIFSYSFIVGFFFKLAVSGNATGFFDKTIIPILLGFVSSLVYFPLILSSFKKREMSDKFLKTADMINIAGVFLSVLAVIIIMVFLSKNAAQTMDFDLLDKANNLLNKVTWVGGITYGISFVTFLIGFIFGRKKEASSTNL
jgi:hypothetical protein